MYKLSYRAILKLAEDGTVLMYIPLDDSNSDYMDYMKWLADGNTPLPADA